MKSKLIIFVKNPIKGHVKTRLAKKLGETEALKVYTKLLSYTRRVTEHIEAEKEICYSQSIEQDRAFWGDHFSFGVQSGDDLGARMSNAFEESFQQGFNKVVLIGSDCAELTPEILNKAFDSLDYHDVTVGPAEDGGYYLIGMAGYYPDLLSGIVWSTDAVYDQTLNKITKAGLSFCELPTLNDVDEPEDWELVRHKFRRA